MTRLLAAEVACAARQNSKLLAEVAELADARDSKSREVTPHVGSIPTFGTLIPNPAEDATRRTCKTRADSLMVMF